MDGFAYAGESLVGRYIGACDGGLLRKAVKYLFRWGWVLAALFTVLYATMGEIFLYLFTDDESIIGLAQPYMIWIVAMPLCGFAAFLWDGIYVGATASRQMRNAMFVATAVFFAIYYGTKVLMTNGLLPDAIAVKNNCLWTAFLAYLLLRGIMQYIFSPKAIYKQVEQE
jgi:MATE family multidrug resistance protein